jgi:hypothetical protein
LSHVAELPGGAPTWLVKLTNQGKIWSLPVHPADVGARTHSDGFVPGAPQMIRERLEPLSAEAKHQVMAGGAMGFYGLH